MAAGVARQGNTDPNETRKEKGTRNFTEAAIQSQ
jgi:hypothetical protein